MEQRTALLRMLLADEDDVHAFAIRCAIKRLVKPSAFLRVANSDVLAQKIRAFEPELLIVSGTFATAGELRQMKQLTNGSPIVCVGKSASDAEASLRAGASDCLLLSQENELGACLEKHLNGKW